MQEKCACIARIDLSRSTFGPSMRLCLWRSVRRRLGEDEIIANRCRRCRRPRPDQFVGAIADANR